MHVMQLVSGRDINGAASHCAMLSDELARRGHRVTFVCREGAWVADHIRQLAEDSGVSIEIMTSNFKRLPTSELRRLKIFLREQQVDVMHSHQCSANTFIAFLRRMTGVPAVATAHNRRAHLHWMFCDHVIATSEATFRYHRRWSLVRKNRMTVIRNFINESRFVDTPVDSSRNSNLRRELDIAQDRLIIGAVGRLVSLKGFHVLIDALPEIQRAIPTATLVVVGDGDAEYGRRLREQAQDRGVASMICWAGFRSDIPQTLAAYDLYVLPSLDESLPLSVIEAMASARAVVATMVSGVPECVVQGTTGELVPPGDPAALARAIIQLLKDPDRVRQYAQAGRQRVLDEFSFAGQTDKIEQLLQDVAGKK